VAVAVGVADGTVVEVVGVVDVTVVEVVGIVDVTVVEAVGVVDVVAFPPHPAKIIETNNRTVNRINPFFILPPKFFHK
jgi:DNA/RNA endonuclease YhcR with UshA esterase domain